MVLLSPSVLWDGEGGEGSTIEDGKQLHTKEGRDGSTTQSSTAQKGDGFASLLLWAGPALCSPPPGWYSKVSDVCKNVLVTKNIEAGVVRSVEMLEKLTFELSELLTSNEKQMCPLSLPLPLPKKQHQNNLNISSFLNFLPHPPPKNCTNNKEQIQRNSQY